MQVWKIKTINGQGETLSYQESVARFAAATVSVVLLGLGFVWMYFNKERLALHDVVSNSHVVYLGDKPYRSEMS